MWISGVKCNGEVTAAPPSATGFAARSGAVKEGTRLRGEGLYSEARTVQSLPKRRGAADHCRQEILTGNVFCSGNLSDPCCRMSRARQVVCRGEWCKYSVFCERIALQSKRMKGLEKERAL
jgi:hypothetical protein